ncbi:hypothetical protein [Peribacillus loiseleuriae]|uniref:Uncharacterized protein n=1 Tax=Peribacillus loiseleuriae TaxID=1679170 RepID=A0A0K9GV01_9BACI|nr:hypothetical protein [Peribacillus loiseleuriae]KMY50072.1 hypothetical protein AC625_11615 [Peribacillus loiseleuriae]
MNKQAIFIIEESHPFVKYISSQTCPFSHFIYYSNAAPLVEQVKKAAEAAATVLKFLHPLAIHEAQKSALHHRE